MTGMLFNIPNYNVALCAFRFSRGEDMSPIKQDIGKTGMEAS